MATSSLNVNFCGMRMSNPTILASGIMGSTADSLIRVAAEGAGAVTSKSCSIEPRTGHKNPTVLEWEHGVINAVGLSNPGVEHELVELKKAVAKSKAPVIASIFADKAEKFGPLAQMVSEAKPAMIEINASCPNVEAEFGKPFAAECTSAELVTRIVKENTKIPVIVKLSPNVPSIKAIALAVESAGADAINAINTIGPGMIIDIESGKPVLANKVGGVSGPAIRPVAVKCVYDICSAVKIPVIGTGGISNGHDAVEMIMAGASAVGIGTAIYYHDISVFPEICTEMEIFMQRHGYKKLEDFRGLALR